MRKIILFLLWCCTNTFLNAQGIKISNTSTAPDPSAILDVESNGLGVLFPRLTTVERDAINSPAIGLIIFNTDCQNLNINTTSGWLPVNDALLPATPGAITGSSTVCQGQNSVSYFIPAIPSATSYSWTYSGSGATFSGTENSITIDFSLSATSGSLTVSGSNACGEGNMSEDFSIEVSTSPMTPASNTHSSTQTEITWNWNAVSGADGYKFNTTNDYSSATDLGTATSYMQSGLTCGAPYTLYAWAYNECGNSVPVTLTQSTSSCFSCGSSTVTFTYKGSSVSYGTALSTTGKCWLDRNLGATQVATGISDINGAGDLFQWGRGDDGHQTRTSLTTSTQSNSDQPGHNKFILPGTWRNPPNNNLWQGANGINNPCPCGWRVPTETEMNAERIAWGGNNATGALNSPLKLILKPGRRYDGSGAVDPPNGSYGDYWTSTVSGNDSRNMEASGFYSNVRGLGCAVRCIQATDAICTP